MTEVNWVRRTMALYIIRTIIIIVTMMKMEMLVMIIYLFKTWCGRIFTMILSYQTYQINTVVHMVLSRVWRSSFKLFLNELFLSVLYLWNASAWWLRSQKNYLGYLQLEASFGGIKWKNITVQEMFRLYGVMLRMSIDTCHLGGYEGYFKPASYVRFWYGYNVNIFGYGGQA